MIWVMESSICDWWLFITVEVENLRRELHEAAEIYEQQREVLRQRLTAVEKDNQRFQQALRNEKDLHDDDVRRITQELVSHQMFDFNI